jgi:hypothetical protein
MREHDEDSDGEETEETRFNYGCVEYGHVEVFYESFDCF